LSENSPQLLAELCDGDTTQPGDFVCTLNLKTMSLSLLVEVPPDVMGDEATPREEEAESKDDGPGDEEEAIQGQTIQANEVIPHESANIKVTVLDELEETGSSTMESLNFYNSSSSTLKRHKSMKKVQPRSSDVTNGTNPNQEQVINNRRASRRASRIKRRATARLDMLERREGRHVDDSQHRNRDGDAPPLPPMAHAQHSTQREGGQNGVMQFNPLHERTRPIHVEAGASDAPSTTTTFQPLVRVENNGNTETFSRTNKLFKTTTYAL
jgi:hypothetical protein